MACSNVTLLLLRRVDCNDGVASYCETLIKGLNALGDRVVIVSGPVTVLYGSAPRRAAIADAVLDWVIVDDLGSARLRPSVARRILATMRQHAVDVISPQGLSLLPLTFLLSKLSGRPVVANYHPSMVGGSTAGVATRRSFKSRLSYRLLTTLFTPDRLIAISSDIARFYNVDCGVSTSRIVRIVNGIDINTYRPPGPEERRAARERHAIGADALVCVLSGRLNFVKGHDIVVDAIRALRQTRPAMPIICLFPGAGDQAEAIRAYALKDEADTATFRFLGFIGDVASLREVYWASDIALLPSRFEGSPIFIAEAMSCGCVPVRTPSGGWQDQIIDGATGFIVPFNDPRALADRIEALSESSRRATMRGHAITHARETLSQEKMVAATAELYRAVARKAGASAP